MKLTRWEIFNITLALLKVQDADFIEHVKTLVKRGREFGGAAIQEQLEKEMADRVSSFWDSTGIVERSGLNKREAAYLTVYLIYQIGGTARQRQHIKRQLCPHLYPAV